MNEGFKPMAISENAASVERESTSEPSLEEKFEIERKADFNELKRLVEDANTLEEFIDVLDKIEEIEFIGTDDGGNPYRDVYTGDEFIDVIKRSLQKLTESVSLSNSEQAILREEIDEGMITIRKTTDDSEMGGPVEELIDLRAKALLFIDSGKYRDQSSRKSVLDRIEEVNKPFYKEGIGFGLVPNEFKIAVWRAIRNGAESIYFSDLTEKARKKISDVYRIVQDDDFIVMRSDDDVWKVWERALRDEEGYLERTGKEFPDLENPDSPEVKALSYIKDEKGLIKETFDNWFGYLLLNAREEDGDSVMLESDLEDCVREAISAGRDNVLFSDLSEESKDYLRKNVKHQNFSDDLLIMTSKDKFWQDVLKEDKE